MRIVCQADADTNGNMSAIHVEWLLSHVSAQTFGDYRPLLVIRIRQQTQELIASPSAHPVSFAQGSLRDSGHGGKNPITGSMTIGVIDYLEAIHIQQQQTVRTAVALRLRVLAFQHLLQGTAIEQAGDRVDSSKILQLLPCGRLVQRHSRELQKREERIQPHALKIVRLICVNDHHTMYDGIDRTERQTHTCLELIFKRPFASRAECCVRTYVGDHGTRGIEGLAVKALPRARAASPPHISSTCASRAHGIGRVHAHVARIPEIHPSESDARRRGNQHVTRAP